jgi:hypothetical protein
MGALSVVVAQVAQAQSLPNPLEKAKEGQWIQSKSVAGGMTTQMYQWVSKVDGKKITLRTQILNADGKTAMMAGTDGVIDLAQTGSSAPAGSADAPKPAISDDEVEVKGKKLKCKKIEVKSGPITSTTWISEEVPVTGLVKSISTQDGNEVAKLELVDFGQQGGADKPVGAPGAGGSADGAGAAGGTEAAPAAAANFAVGQDVGAKWVNPKDNKEFWFTAKILSVKEDTFAIEYGDGELGKVKKDWLRPLVKPSEVKAGDRVVAAWAGKPRMYAGSVESTTDDEIIVKWDDGSPASGTKQAFRE